MEIELNTIKEIAVEYFDTDDKEKFRKNWKDFIYCYKKIRDCSCVKSKDYGSLIDCLYLVASDIASNEFFRTSMDCYGNKFDNFNEKCKSLDYIISDALYRIYDEYAIPSLSNQYIHIKRLER